MTRVLVIDDDKSVCAAIEVMLRRNSCDAVLADSATLGTEIFKSGQFDMVIVDIFMPGVDGLEAIKGFRKSAPKIPIIAMSSFEFRSANVAAPAPDFLGMAVKCGATLSLRKPFGPELLMAAIDVCLGGRPPAEQTNHCDGDTSTGNFESPGTNHFSPRRRNGWQFIARE